MTSGGYTIIDLKGMTISTQASSISEDIINTLIEAHKYKKPIMISNFTIAGNVYSAVYPMVVSASNTYSFFIPVDVGFFKVTINPASKQIYNKSIIFTKEA